MPLFGYAVIAVFLGVLTTGTLVMLGLSVSACFVVQVLRCFSISRDTGRFLFKMIEMWSLPALAVALLVAIVVQFRGPVVWWKVFLAAALVAISEMLLESINQDELYETPFFVAQGLVLFIGAQLSLRIGRRLRRFPI
jgi:hypothetical protein